LLGVNDLLLSEDLFDAETPQQLCPASSPSCKHFVPKRTRQQEKLQFYALQAFCLEHVVCLRCIYPLFSAFVLHPGCNSRAWLGQNDKNVPIFCGDFDFYQLLLKPVTLLLENS